MPYMYKCIHHVMIQLLPKVLSSFLYVFQIQQRPHLSRKTLSEVCALSAGVKRRASLLSVSPVLLSHAWPSSSPPQFTVCHFMSSKTPVTGITLTYWLFHSASACMLTWA